jgi:hypothetical protein
MKPLLMYRDRDFDVNGAPTWNEEALMQDLELDTLLRAMAGDDEVIHAVARRAIFSGLQNDVVTILYRQEAVKDCFKNPSTIRELYDLMGATIDMSRREWWGISGHYPSSMLYSSLHLLESSLDVLRKLRSIAEEVASRFDSEAFTAMFAMIRKELNDAYLGSIQDHLSELKFRKGVMMSAELGARNEGTHYVLRRSRENEPRWFLRLLGKGRAGYTFHVDSRDETGLRILSDMRHDGISRVAVAVAQSADHVLNFFKTLRTELAFYVGCLNLGNRLSAKEEPICLPTPKQMSDRSHRFAGLYDVCLSLHMEKRVVANAFDALGRSLIVITGANQGGKSSFLRSIGLAQVMMQSGMFVGADEFTAEICPALFTHYKREEDPTMKSGKFDEELSRMSGIVDHMAANSIILFNESFAATNEREGSEIAGQIVCALLEKRVKIFYVTHLYDFAHGLYESKLGEAIFLSAERKADGTRTFKLVEGEPLATSHGKDLYQQIFEGDGQGEEVKPKRRSTEVVV